MAEMTEESLIQLCNSMQNQGIYRTPEINDKLYLHCQGYRTVSPEAMKRYTGLKVLWLQSNGLTGIQGLDTCTKLRTLYLHENVIEVMENLDYLVELYVGRVLLLYYY
jgi:dynein assembly factor 1